MKRFLNGCLTAFLTLCFVASCTSCVNDSKEAVGIKKDSVEVKLDTVTDIESSVDTLKVYDRCVAITKNGVQCKNHPVAGDSLCSVHKRLR